MGSGPARDRNFQSHASSRTLVRWGVPLGGWNEFLSVVGQGLAMGTLDTAPFILGAGATARMTFDGEHRPARRSVGRLAAPRQSPAAPEGPREWDEAARLLRALGR